ncbi:hypothetical protein BDP27DRAFT_1320761 [Rhodocollybia butyracea]|uniref:Uncharacterized protein n=1 Tax=Rhodocollybia butyracea TaxID=206335 RepID=A0A9P5Q1F1_9AGAR|nr:hypothetical protein BDP27DRAFT_1320761 [Rhodocollybia butyracea]
MARGDRYSLTSEDPEKPAYSAEDFSKWYVGISKGQPAQGSFEHYKGKPVWTKDRDDRITTAMRAQWKRIFTEFKDYFMIPEVTFTPFPTPPTNLVLSPEPPESEDPRKELNGALGRGLGDRINYSSKGRYYKVHELNMNTQWVYFELIGGAKRCSTASPCLGCILLESGTKHVLIAQRKTGQGSSNEAKVDRIGAYYSGLEKNEAVLRSMEMQLVEHYWQFWKPMSTQPPPVDMPILTFIDGKTREDLGSNDSKAPTGVNLLLKVAFGTSKPITYKGLLEPRHMARRRWLYFKVVGVPGCTDLKPCVGWLAKGLKPSIRNTKEEEFGAWYVGFSSSWPVQDHFKGRPEVRKKSTRKLEMMQVEWDKICAEFKNYFMIPEVTFAPFHAPQTNQLSPNPPESEDPRKELNGALGRGLGDRIIYNPLGRYYKVHEHDAQWVYFRLVGGDKRCPTGRPCFGCIVLESDVLKYVLIVQKRKPEQVSLNEAKVEWVRAYYNGLERNEDVLTIMEMQLEYQFIPRFNPSLGPV